MSGEQKVINWVNTVFAKEGYTNLHVEFPQYDNRGGSLAQIIFVTVKGEKEKNSETFELIIKASKNDAVALDNLNFRIAYENEVKFYSKIVTGIEELAKEKNSQPFKNIPKCYGTISEGNDYVVFLDNLKPKGFKPHVMETPQDINHVKLVLEAYAKWHALCLAMRHQKPKCFDEFKCNHVFNIGTKVYKILVGTTHKQLDFVLGLYENKKNSVIFEKLKTLRNTFEDIHKDCLLNKNEEHLVVRHGDCWNNNYLFHYSEGTSQPDEVIIIDWQNGAFGSPLEDVAKFLFNCCSKKELEHLDELLDFYYSTLSSKMRELGSDPDECFSWDTCQKSFRRYAPLGIASMTVIVRMCYKVNTEETYDITQAEKDGNFEGIFGEGIRDFEGYFNRINDVLELCVARSYI